MPSEREAIANLSDGDNRWFQLWSFQVNQLDQKAGIIVTLDGILIALTASFLGSVLSVNIPSVPKALFGASTILVLISAGACSRVIWVKFWASKIFAESKDIDEAYVILEKRRARKTQLLNWAILALLAALTGYAMSILLLLVQR